MFDSVKDSINKYLVKKIVVETEGDRACPCLYLDEPCKPNCTCRNSFSSAGCENCCTYGSFEQRKDKAKILNDLRVKNQ